MKPVAKTAIVFDLDGTLIDSVPDVAAALNRLLAEEGRRVLTVPEVEELVGEGVRVLIEKAFAVTGTLAPDAEVPALIARYKAFYAAHPADHTIVFPGAVAALERLAAAGHPLGICTNKPSDITGLVLDALDLSKYFAAVLGGDFPRRKPDGEHIRETLRQMGAGDRPAVMIGDSRTDVAAARDAGLAVVAVSFGYGGGEAHTLGADIVIDHFDALDRAVESLK